MRRTLVPALTLALLPFAAASPADAGTATPPVITPTSGPATLSFTLAEDLPAAALEIRSPSGTLVYAGTPADLTAGEHTFLWDGRTAAGAAVGDASYVATLRATDAAEPLAERTPVRVNLAAPRTSTAPRVSATSVFPYRDGYRDAVTISGQNATSDVSYSRATQILNPAGAVVWSSTATSARWTGRTSTGYNVAPGRFRVRTKFVDRDGLVGYSPARAITVSPKRLVTRTLSDTLSPRDFLLGTYLGKCGKVIKPARKGKGWKYSVSVSSNHRCTSKPRKSATEAQFSVAIRNVYDYSAFKVQVLGGGHTKSRKNVAIGYGITADWDDISTPRRLATKYKKRTIFSTSGRSLRRYVDDRGFFDWAVTTFNGARYDIKLLRLKTTYRILVDPTTRSDARVAPTASFVARG